MQTMVIHLHECLQPSSLTLFVPKQVAVIVLMEIAHQAIITHAGISPTLFESMMWAFICSLFLLHHQLGKHNRTPESCLVSEVLHHF